MHLIKLTAIALIFGAIVLIFFNEYIYEIMLIIAFLTLLIITSQKGGKQ